MLQSRLPADRHRLAPTREQPQSPYMVRLNTLHSEGQLAVLLRGGVTSLCGRA